jgi:hypothetical protein
MSHSDTWISSRLIVRTSIPRVRSTAAALRAPAPAKSRRTLSILLAQIECMVDRSVVFPAD